MNAGRTFLFLLVAVILSGCRHVAETDGSVSRDGSSGMLAEYLSFCREVALSDIGNCREDLMGDEGCSVVTTWESDADYRIVFADDRHLSFRAVEYAFRGGAHGGRRITVGTIDRRTGKRLKAADMVPADRRKDVADALRNAVIRHVGGEDGLMGEVGLVDNCCILADGIHFVFNEYEVACYAVGAIDAVVRLRDGDIAVSASAADAEVRQNDK